MLTCKNVIGKHSDIFGDEDDGARPIIISYQVHDSGRPRAPRATNGNGRPP